VDHRQLRPGIGIAQRHQLAAGEVADANDEARLPQLLGEAVAADVEELGRPVHGETPGPRPAGLHGGADPGGEQGDVGGDVGEVDVDVADLAAAALVPEHHRLDEVEELPEQAARAGRRQPQRPGQHREIDAGPAQRQPQMSA
jgi:hypothetical protein